MSSFYIHINGQKCLANPGEKVLEVAMRENIFIPALCYHCDLMPHESCRLCMVEIEGEKGLRASCSLIAKQGMKISTTSARVKESLITNLELIWAQHEGKCHTCKRKSSCKLHELAKYYVYDKHKYSDRKAGKHAFQFGPAITFEPDKCINCENCSEVCAQQTNGGFLRPREGKFNFEVGPSHDASLDCIYCGQCIIHCPTGALSEVEEYQIIKKMIDSGKKVIFQFAPSVRTSLGEEFGLKPGSNVTDKIYSALKVLGAYKVFDSSFGADITIMEEAAELLHKIKKASGKGQGRNEVMFSSCCPAWVKYIEFYEPEFIANLTSVRSPQIILGGVIKTYWAESQKINPKELIVVSVMPCTSKKNEVLKKELAINGMAPVDYSLTVREFAKLLKSANIDLAKIEPDTSDKEMLADPTGGGEIFGASGGVLEAALRTAYFMLSGKNLEQVEFKELHRQKGFKVLELEIGGSKLKFAAVSGMVNAKKILSELKVDKTAYSCVEVMACPGGCIGGGGQPMPVDDKIRKARADGLYNADRSRAVRLCHQNPGIVKLYKDFLKDKKTKHLICHTSFAKKSKGKIINLK